MATYNATIFVSASTTNATWNVTTTVANSTIFEGSNASTEVSVTAILGVSLAFILTSNIVLNSLFVFVGVRSKELQRAPHYFMVNLACVDIAGGLLWSLFTLISVVLSRWILGDGLCRLQGVLGVFVFLTSVHNFVIIVAERAMKTGLTDKHKEIFNQTSSLIIIFTLWVFDLVTAILPLIGWGGYVYFSKQFQCGLNFEKSIAQLYFVLVIGYVVPVVGIFMCFISHFCKLRQQHGSVSPTQMSENEKQRSKNRENKEKGQENTLISESYGKRFRRQQIRFQNFPVNKYILNGENCQITDCSKNNKRFTPSVVDEKIQVNKRQRATSISSYMTDTNLSATVLITVFMYMILWFPFIVLNYLDLLEVSFIVPDSAWVASVWLTHLSTVIKPVIYFTHNKLIRNASKSVLCVKIQKPHIIFKSKPEREKQTISSNTAELKNTTKVILQERVEEKRDQDDGRESDYGSDCSSGSSTTAFNEPKDTSNVNLQQAK
ncbi:tyramine receptor Ser-2 [Lingula anatina]|uniref:Tyramine receptor Ser-2 n=1 Tax=Lingula anatina TaxID=7574 RepID=A0A2R2MKF0_LINAN|nr:tyramine receptor Ser-2 [Lingula anatina]|eukprot:XP_023930699.1 tyramine receptor Ser-2 [Lingula anatina]